MKSPENSFGKKPESASENKDENSDESKETLNLEFAAATEKGEKHPINQDAYFLLPEKGACGVFDGVGSHSGGEIASALARDYIKKLLMDFPEDISEKEATEKLQDIFIDAHKFILAEAKKNNNLSEMATTACVVKFLKKKALIATAGDTRVYGVMKNQALEQITIDNSQINHDFLIEGKSEQEIREFQQKVNKSSEGNELTILEKALLRMLGDVITNGLGGGSGFTGIPQIRVIDLQNIEALLLTSDGNYKNLTDWEMAEIIKKIKDSKQAANSIVQTALVGSREQKFRSHPDDMTAVVVKVS